MLAQRRDFQLGVDARRDIGHEALVAPFFADDDYRLITLDDVLLALPPTGWRLRPK